MRTEKYSYRLWLGGGGGFTQPGDWTDNTHKLSRKDTQRPQPGSPECYDITDREQNTSVQASVTSPLDNKWIYSLSNLIRKERKQDLSG